MDLQDIIQLSCCTTGENIPDDQNRDVTCPVCKQPGTKVPNVTVRHIVRKDFIARAGDDDHYLCMNDKCEVTYYNKDHSTVFVTDELKVPLWYKHGANPVYACYCSRITEDDVERAVREMGITDIPGIRNLYDPDGKCQCRINNPTGRCCHSVFQHLIDRALEGK